MLLAFAVWSLLILLFTIAVYRWSRILTGRAAIKDFRADDVQGEDWYKRAMRAHANCLENLPVFAAIVFALHASNTASPLIDVLSGIVMAARVCQTCVHVGFVQSKSIVFLRFLFFVAQLIAFLIMAWQPLRTLM